MIQKRFNKLFETQSKKISNQIDCCDQFLKAIGGIPIISKHPTNKKNAIMLRTIDYEEYARTVGHARTVHYVRTNKNFSFQFFQKKIDRLGRHGL